MRILIFLSVLPLFLISCQPERERSFDNTMLECFIKGYAQYGIDITKSIDSANAVLVEYEVLPDISGESFINMIKQFQENDGLPFDPSPELITALEEIQYLPASIGCSDSVILDFDSAQIRNSKAYALIDIFDSVATSGEISTQLITTQLLAKFDSQDFDHPLLSSFGTMVLSNLIKLRNDRGIFSRLPPPPDPDNFDSSNILEVKMVTGDTVFVDKSEVNADNIESIVYEFIVENENTGVVKVSSHRGVSYELYIRVLDHVNKAYEKFHDLKSMEQYGSELKDLKSEQQRELRAQYPKLISISEPEKR